jgi:hypothetical protein
MTADARKFVADAWPDKAENQRKLFQAQQMTKKSKDKDPADLLTDAGTAWDSAVAEVEAFDKDVAYMALAFFQTRQTVDDFIASLKSKYPVIETGHLEWTAKDEWAKARTQIQADI